MASLAKWLSVRLRTKWLWVRVQMQSLKTVNAYIVFDLDNCPKTSLRSFKLTRFLLGAINIVKKSDKEKYVHIGYGIAFDVKSEWNFGNDFDRTVVIFGVSNSSSSNTENRKNDFLTLGKGNIFGINGRFDAPGKKNYN